MNVILQNIVGSLVRLALGALVGWLINKGVMQPGQEAAFYAAATTSALAVGWAIWNNVLRRRLLNTAAASKPGPVADIVDAVKRGDFASALTPQDEHPVIVGKAGRS